MRAFLAAAVLLLLVPPRASAEGPYEGTWTASALRVRHSVASWGDDCGPRPPSSASIPGGSTQIAQSGDHLRFSGAVTGSTRACWSDRPSINRISSRFVDPGTWTIVCRTSESAAEQENGRYTFRANEERTQLSYSERTEWNWQLRSSSCRATRTATRTFTRQGAAPPPTIEEPMESEPEQPRCTPGAPTRVRLRPSEATIEPGAEQCFRATVVDRAGCPVPGERAQLSLQAPTSREGRLEGRCFVAGETAADAEGTFRLTARWRESRDTASVVVQSEDLSHLIARREHEGSGGDVGRAETGEASGVAARTVGGGSTLPWILGGVGLLVIAAIFGIVAARRRKSTIPEVVDDPPAAPSAPPPVVVPEAAETPQQGLICPTCRRGYPSDAKFCPHDQTALIPYAEFLERGSLVSTRMVCPECGETYGPEKTFCPNDGARLEVVS